jgi:BirA family biotin operon repressor/biotin-[acetyl-CoA-carboxylase] ligase
VWIKWPNDLLLDGRKLAGILAELRSTAGKGCDLVLGVGVNVTEPEGGFPADLRGRAIALHPGAQAGMLLRERLAGELLLELAGLHPRLAAGDWDPVARCWESLAPGARGQAVRVLSAPLVEKGTLLYEGLTEGLDTEGALKVRREDGTLEMVRTAETVVPLE